MRRSPAFDVYPNGWRWPKTNYRRVWTWLTRPLADRARRNIPPPRSARWCGGHHLPGMVSLQTFEVEQVLGTPFRFFVFSTTIYDLLVTRVPRYDAAPRWRCSCSRPCCPSSWPSSG